MDWQGAGAARRAARQQRVGRRCMAQPQPGCYWARLSPCACFHSVQRLITSASPLPRLLSQPRWLWQNSCAPSPSVPMPPKPQTPAPPPCQAQPCFCAAQLLSFPAAPRRPTDFIPLSLTTALRPLTAPPFARTTAPCTSQSRRCQRCSLILTMHTRPLQPLPKSNQTIGRTAHEAGTGVDVQDRIDRCFVRGVFLRPPLHPT